MPLHGNLDLLNFISFSKGCYVGQELTARTKHRGAVRRRFFSVVAAAEGDPHGLLTGLGLAPHAPLPAQAFAKAADAKGEAALLPGPSADEAARTVHALRPGSEEWKACGTLHTTAGNLGLCLLRGDISLNHPESFLQAETFLPPGTQLRTADGTPLGIRAPPYAFVASE